MRDSLIFGMELLFHELGINGYTLLAQITNFLILLFVLKKFLYKPLLGFMDQRSALIETGLINAEKAKQELSRVNEIKEEKIIEGEREAEKIIENSKKIATKKGAGILKEAEEKSENIIQEAKKIAEEERKSAALGLKKDLANLVALASINFVENNITSEDNEKIINKYLESLN